MSTESPIFTLIDYLLEQWMSTANRQEESIQAGSIVMISLSDLQEQKKIDIDTGRDWLRYLYSKGCFRITHEKRLFNFQRLVAIDDTEELCMAEGELPKGCMLGLEDIDCLRIFEVKLDLQKKRGKSILKPTALENIARKMGDSDSGVGLVKFLKDCEVPLYLINYPNTKWRMLNDLFRVLASSVEDEHHQLLLTVFEKFCHPLRYGGDKEKAKEMEDFIADQICYDDFYFGYLRKGISKVESDDPEVGIILSSIEEDREERKKERNQKSSESGAGFGEFMDFLQPKSHKQNTQTKAKESQPISVVIHNSNVQNNTQESQRKQVSRMNIDGNYIFNDLVIDLKARALRNNFLGKERDIAGFEYAFVKTLIEANGELVTYAEIAEAAKDGTVDTMTDKEVMDAKSRFTTMLKKELQLSEATCEQIVLGKSGYRINSKIYE